MPPLTRRFGAILSEPETNHGQDGRPAKTSHFSGSYTKACFVNGHLGAYCATFRGSHWGGGITPLFWSLSPTMLMPAWRSFTMGASNSSIHQKRYHRSRKALASTTKREQSRHGSFYNGSSEKTNIYSNISEPIPFALSQKEHPFTRPYISSGTVSQSGTPRYTFLLHKTGATITTIHGRFPQLHNYQVKKSPRRSRSSPCPCVICDLRSRVQISLCAESAFPLLDAHYPKRARRCRVQDDLCLVKLSGACGVFGGVVFVW